MELSSSTRTRFEIELGEVPLVPIAREGITVAIARRPPAKPVYRAGFVPTVKLDPSQVEDHRGRRSRVKRRTPRQGTPSNGSGSKIVRPVPQPQRPY